MKKSLIALAAATAICAPMAASANPALQEHIDQYAAESAECLKQAKPGYLAPVCEDAGITAELLTGLIRSAGLKPSQAQKITIQKAMADGLRAVAIIKRGQ